MQSVHDLLKLVRTESGKNSVNAGARSVKRSCT